MASFHNSVAQSLGLRRRLGGSSLLCEMKLKRVTHKNAGVQPQPRKHGSRSFSMAIELQKCGKNKPKKPLVTLVGWLGAKRRHFQRQVSFQTVITSRKLSNWEETTFGSPNVKLLALASQWALRSQILLSYCSLLVLDQGQSWCPSCIKNPWLQVVLHLRCWRALIPTYQSRYVDLWQSLGHPTYGVRPWTSSILIPSIGDYQAQQFLSQLQALQKQHADRSLLVHSFRWVNWFCILIRINNSWCQTSSSVWFMLPFSSRLFESGVTQCSASIARLCLSCILCTLVFLV